MPTKNSEYLTTEYTEEPEENQMRGKTNGG